MVLTLELKLALRRFPLGEEIEMVEHLPIKCEALSLYSSATKKKKPV
jgi:hypothetical protein